MGIVDDVKRSISMDLKQAGNLIYIVGDTKNELGASAYFDTKGYIGNKVPRVDAGKAKAQMDRLSIATAKGLVQACHDCSEGGIGVAVAEMAFAGELGSEVNLKAVPLGEKITRDDFILFSESNSRFIVEVTLENKDDFEKVMSGADFARIGSVKKTKRLKVNGLKGQLVLNESIADLKEAWQKPLRW
jgi:phosphoribosylformylglycinamidine synthase